MVLTTGLIYFGTDLGDHESTDHETTQVDIQIPSEGFPEKPNVTLPKQAGPEGVNTPPSTPRSIPNKGAPKSASWVDLTKKSAPQATGAADDFPVKRRKSIPFIKKKSIGQKINENLEKAGKLETTELQDAAYLDIIDQAIAGDAFTRGLTIAEKLSTSEIRDAARLRVASHLMRGGQMQRGLNVFKNLELETSKTLVQDKIIDLSDQIILENSN